MPKDDPTYIGDGVYVSDDGYQLWLAANDHRNLVIALDPTVCLQLIRQMARVVDAEQMHSAVVSVLREQGLHN